MTFNRLSLLAVATLFSFNVWAYGSNYDAAQFEQSIAQKKTILIHVHAPWCPVGVRPARDVVREWDRDL